MAFACWLPVSCAAGGLWLFLSPHSAWRGLSHWSPASAGRSLVCNYVHLEHLRQWIWFFGSLNKGSFHSFQVQSNPGSTGNGQSLGRIMNNGIRGFWPPWDNSNDFYHCGSKCLIVHMWDGGEKLWETRRGCLSGAHSAAWVCVSACWQRGTSALMDIHPQT